MVSNTDSFTTEIPRSGAGTDHIDEIAGCCSVAKVSINAMPEDSVSTKVRGMMLGCLDAWALDISRENCGGHGTDPED